MHKTLYFINFVVWLKSPVIDNVQICSIEFTSLLQVCSKIVCISVTFTVHVEVCVMRKNPTTIAISIDGNTKLNF